MLNTPEKNLHLLKKISKKPLINIKTCFEKKEGWEFFQQYWELFQDVNMMESWVKIFFGSIEHFYKAIKKMILIVFNDSKTFWDLFETNLKKFSSLRIGIWKHSQQSDKNANYWVIRQIEQS